MCIYLIWIFLSYKYSYAYKFVQKHAHTLIYKHNVTKNYDFQSYKILIIQLVESYIYESYVNILQIHWLILSNILDSKYNIHSITDIL